MTDQDCLLTNCWPLRALACMAGGGRVAARPSRHPAAHSRIACAHAGKQRVSEGGPGHVCTRQTRGGTRPGTRTAHEVQAECASVEAAGARVSARCPPWAASPWRSAARHALTGGQESWQERRERLLARRDGQTPSVPTTWTVLGAL